MTKLSLPEHVHKGFCKTLIDIKLPYQESLSISLTSMFCNLNLALDYKLFLILKLEIQFSLKFLAQIKINYFKYKPQMEVDLGRLKDITLCITLVTLGASIHCI